MRISAELLELASDEELAKLDSLMVADQKLQGLKTDLLTFGEFLDPTFTRFTHTEFLAAKLHRLADPNDPMRRLLVSMPPRSGKTYLSSTIFPTWFLLKHPNKTVMLTSATATLSERTLSPRIREFFRTVPELPDISPDRRSKSYFKLASPDAGGLVAAGVGGSITGQPAHLLIVDDPVKSAEDAASRAKSQANWDWYQSTARTRLEPNGLILVVMTRWSDDDLAGRLLENGEGEGEQWHVVNLPAIAGDDDQLGRKSGEPLVPERYDAAELLALKADVGPRVWAALYQGNPVPLTGEFFGEPPGCYSMTDDGKYIVDSTIVDPDDCQHFIVVDGAGATTSRSDASGIVSVAVTRNGYLLLKEAWAKKLRGPALEQWIIDQYALDDRVSYVFIEDSSISKHLIDSLKGARQIPIRSKAPAESKQVRAIGLQRLLDTGRLLFPPVESDGVTEARRELLLFPTGPHDDLVDALAWAANQIKANKRTRIKSGTGVTDSIGSYT